jgi:hypothetical protein
MRYHIIPKPNAEVGLGIGWQQIKPSQDQSKALFEEIKSKM